MRALVLGLLIGLVMMTGCSRRTVPVSLNTENNSSLDSLYSLTADSFDSTYYKETLEEKTTPKASIGITLEKKQLDSLINALGNLPSSVSKVLYYKDPESRAILTVMLDSLQRIRIECEATAQTYYQKTIEQSRTIQRLSSELQAVKAENTKLVTEVRQEKLSWWSKAWMKMKSFGFGAFFVVFMIIVVVIGWYIKK